MPRANNQPNYRTYKGVIEYLAEQATETEHSVDMGQMVVTLPQLVVDLVARLYRKAPTIVLADATRFYYALHQAGRVYPSEAAASTNGRVTYIRNTR